MALLEDAEDAKDTEGAKGRMLAVNRDIMIRTACVIGAFAFFAAQGARSGDTALAANAVLQNFVMIGSFFLDGMATAAEQLCGRAVGARDRLAFVRATGLSLLWGFGFGGSLDGGVSHCRHRAHRPDDDQRGGAPPRARVLAVRSARAGAGRARLYIRRRLYRRHLGARHAQFDAHRLRALSRHLVGVAELRQCRTVGGDPHLPHRTRPAAGSTPSSAAAGDVLMKTSAPDGDTIMDSVGGS